VEFEGVGHAPTLMSADQTEVVRDFLLADSKATADESRSKDPC
jgi:hypothetical protein